jgi:phosphohistidine phosphatase
VAGRRQLLLLRHADAGDPERWDRSDSERPLSPLGEAQARRVGEHLKAIGFRTGAFRTSPKVRARRTAELAAERLGATVRVEDFLAGSYDLATVAASLAELPDDAPPEVLVGHDPDLSALLSELVGASLSLRKGALALVDWRGNVEPGEARLRWLLPPDALAGPGGDDRLR